MTIKSVPKGTSKYPIQTAIIVPATEYDKIISNTKFKQRIKATRTLMSNLFGGYTSVKSVGGYTSKSNKLIKEDGTIVIAYAKEIDFQIKKQKWINWLKRKKITWKQESIGFIIENDMFYI